MFAARIAPLHLDWCLVPKVASTSLSQVTAIPSRSMTIKISEQGRLCILDQLIELLEGAIDPPPPPFIGRITNNHC
jgi:hypothetical protein